MYNKKRYGYTVVAMEKEDYAIENLENDLLNWENRLHKIENKNFIFYRGLLPNEGIERLSLLQAASPYGAGYKITVENEDIKTWLRWTNLA